MSALKRYGGNVDCKPSLLIWSFDRGDESSVMGICFNPLFIYDQAFEGLSNSCAHACMPACHFFSPSLVRAFSFRFPASHYSSHHHCPGSPPHISLAWSPVLLVLQNLVLWLGWRRCQRCAPFRTTSWLGAGGFDLLARATFLARLGDQVSSLIDGDFSVVAGA